MNCALRLSVTIVDMRRSRFAADAAAARPGAAAPDAGAPAGRAAAAPPLRGAAPAAGAPKSAATAAAARGEELDGLFGEEKRARDGQREGNGSREARGTPRALASGKSVSLFFSMKPAVEYTTAPA